MDKRLEQALKKRKYMKNQETYKDTQRRISPQGNTN